MEYVALGKSIFSDMTCNQTLYKSDAKIRPDGRLSAIRQPSRSTDLQHIKANDYYMKYFMER